MKKPVRLLALLAVAAFAREAQATPSTIFWTPATTYVQPFLVPHLGMDAYVGDRAAYPLDLGLTIGILPFEKLQAEVGLDAFLPYAGGFFLPPAGPLMLNAKVGIPDGAFGEWFPGISAGIYGVGLTSSMQFDILHGEIGKAFSFGTFTVGGYYGAGGGDVLWTGSSGVVRGGFIGSYLSPDVVLDLKGLNKINFFADVQTGKNAFGAWGFGIGAYFTPAIAILTGPIFFLDKTVQPPFGPSGQNMMWTIQLDVDLDFAPAPKAPEPPKA